MRRVVRIGKPFVFVPGNHDSDSLARQLARDGAIVLTRIGPAERRRRRPTATRSSTVAGLRVAGYDDPFERRAGEDFADRYNRAPDAAEHRALRDLAARRSATTSTSSWSTTRR